MNCDHCDTIRRNQQAVIDEHSTEYPGLYVTARPGHSMTLAVTKHTREHWGTMTPELRASLPTCDCECHDIARRFGSLGLVEVAS